MRTLAILAAITTEDAFQDKEYNGGATGANFNLAVHFARSANKRFFAVARGGPDGHAFAFNSLDTELVREKGSLAQGGGCERPCVDVEDKVCGCMDGACTAPTARGEEHNRRWAIYEVLPGGGGGGAGEGGVPPQQQQGARRASRASKASKAKN